MPNRCPKCGATMLHPVDPMDNFPMECFWVCSRSEKDCRIRELEMQVEKLTNTKQENS